jgi:hypothetical protein
MFFEFSSTPKYLVSIIMGIGGTNIKRDSASNDVICMKNLKRAYDWFYKSLKISCSVAVNLS